MTSRTRYFLGASGFIVVVGLATGLVAYYSGGLGRGQSAAGLSELSYVPPDVTALAYADVRQIMDSEFRQRLRAVMPTGQEKDRMLAETGIDVERDIDSVLAGLNPTALPAAPPIVLLRGRFNDRQIETVAVGHGATVEDYRGRRLVLTQPPSRPGAGGDAGHAGAIAFLEPGLLALGSADAVRRAIDAAEARDTALKNVELMRFVGEVMPTSDAWVVGRVDAMSDNPAIPIQVRDQLAAVQWFALTADIDQALTCRLRAEARDSESAEQIRAVVNGALAMAKMAAGKDARYAGLLDSVQATGAGAEMEVSFTVPPEMLDALSSGVLGQPNADRLQ